jgi:hypothetical protein
MPFTASHPAIILPLLRLQIFSASGLIMGSMVPDFEFFMRLSGQGIHGHTIAGMFWFNIPIALAFIFFYHLCIRDAMISNLPLYFRCRFKPFSSFDFITFFKSNYIKVLYSILVGNMSHIAWDAFTHDDGYFVGVLPVLRTTINFIPLYDIFQYGFTALGAISILLFIRKLPRTKTNYQTTIKRQFTYWCIVLMGVCFVCYFRWNVETYFDLGEFLVVCIGGFMIGLSIASFIDDQKQKRSAYRTA